MADDKSKPFDEIAFIKERHPELFACNERELEKVKTRDALYALECHLKVMIHRGVDPIFWSPKDVLEKIEWICEDYGWDGLGR